VTVSIPTRQVLKPVLAGSRAVWSRLPGFVNEEVNLNATGQPDPGNGFSGLGLRRVQHGDPFGERAEPSPGY
jgi:hypothetical protein